MAKAHSMRDLALRLRRDAETTAMPYYASLMRQAADELDAFRELDRSAPEQRQLQAG